MLVELASVTDGAAVPRAVCAALGLLEQTRQPDTNLIIDVLRQEDLVLILDNCEQVLDACAELATAVLSACTGIKVLATSRERLGIVGETIWRVPPMKLPADDLSLAALETCDAVRLFADRAAAVSSDFALSTHNAAAVARVCIHLDGIPLAIELAAARINVLPVNEIALQLDASLRLLNAGNRTAHPRQRTLEATFDWSFQLLTPTEQRFLSRLSIFVGGWTLESATAVCGGGGIQQTDVLDLLARLVDKSLVQLDSSTERAVRYRLLEPLRQFLSVRRMPQPGDDDVQRQHAHWFGDLVQRAAADFHGPHQAAALRTVDEEYANVRAALQWLLAEFELAPALTIIEALWWFWLRRQQLSEGRAFLECVLPQIASRPPGATPARLLTQAATIAWFQGDYAAAQRWADESLEIARVVDDAPATSYALGVIGRLAVVRGDYTHARRAFDESLTLIRQHGEPWWEARVLEGLATVALQYGDFASAAQVLEQAVRIARNSGDEWSLATVLTGLGDVSRARGDYARAGALYEESKILHQKLGTEPRPSLLHNLAYIAYHQRDLARSAGLFEESLELYRAYGERRGMAECLVGLAGVAAAARDGMRAARLLGAAEALFESLAAELSPSNRADFSRIVALARNGSSPAQYAAAWTAGHELDLESAVQEALMISVPISPRNRQRERSSPLSAREQQVAALVAEGCSNREIAHSLSISEATAERHVANIFAKLGANSRAQVAAWAVQQGIPSAGKP